MTAEAFLIYGVLPAWAAAGFADWVCHRLTDIHKTSGTHESLTHALMLASLGVPATLALLFEIDASVLRAALAGTILHEAIVLWDVAYAANRRKVTTTEQHIHSFLEVLPWMSTGIIASLHPD
ncbi:MAG TPA: hypothetical protein VIG47_09265, partial [Gemmatimonadaceae bacterium]